jgi:hypothetical protein
MVMLKNFMGMDRREQGLIKKEVGNGEIFPGEGG